MFGRQTPRKKSAHSDESTLGLEMARESIFHNPVILRLCVLLGKMVYSFVNKLLYDQEDFTLEIKLTRLATLVL